MSGMTGLNGQTSDVFVSSFLSGWPWAFLQDQESTLQCRRNDCSTEVGLSFDFSTSSRSRVKAEAGIVHVRQCGIPPPGSDPSSFFFVSF